MHPFRLLLLSIFHNVWIDTSVDMLLSSITLQDVNYRAETGNTTWLLWYVSSNFQGQPIFFIFQNNNLYIYIWEHDRVTFTFQNLNPVSNLSMVDLSRSHLLDIIDMVSWSQWGAPVESPCVIIAIIVSEIWWTKLCMKKGILSVRSWRHFTLFKCLFKDS